MKDIVIHDQQEFDNIPYGIEGRIYLANEQNLVVVNRRFRSPVEAYGDSPVEASGNSYVIAHNNSKVVSYDNSYVDALDNSSVVAFDNSSVSSYGNSSVIAHNHASVEAYSDSSVIAYDSASVESRNTSQVRAYDNSSVVAFDNSSVIAYENSSVEAYGNSSVESYSSVLAYEKSSVDLCGWGQCRIMSRDASYRVSDRARVILPFKDIQDYIGYFGIKEDSDEDILLYKAVHKINEKYVSEYDSSFEYAIGQSKEEKVNTYIEIPYAQGLHAGYLEWALKSGRYWDDLAILEVKIAKKDCIVPEFSEGGIRTSRLKVVREISRDEYARR